MSLPTLAEYRQGSTTWKRDYKGVSYTLSHHGISDYSPQGTWCFYIFINSNMFVNHDDFSLFDREAEIVEINGNFRETFNYWDVPDYGFHGGITWYSKEGFVDREGQKQTSLKIGCDYNHLWDRESDYWQGLDEVESDAKSLIDKLVEQHPIKLRCSYCGKIDLPDQYYTAINGAVVHKSQIDKLKENGWDKWMPKEQGAA